MPHYCVHANIPWSAKSGTLQVRDPDGFEGVIMETPNGQGQFVFDTEEGFVIRMNGGLGWALFTDAGGRSAARGIGSS